MKDAILGNPKTTVCGVLCLLVGAMLWAGKIETQNAVVLLTLFLGAMGVVAKQVDKGATVSSAEADRALASVQHAEKQGLIETAPHDSKPEDSPK